MRYLVLILIFLYACAPPTTISPGEKPLPEPVVETVEQVTRPAQNVTSDPVVEIKSTPLTPLSNPERVIEPYSSIGCEQLLTLEQFASSCQKDQNAFSLTYQTGTKNCFITIKDRSNERRTAGITLTAFRDSETAQKEFQRRASVLGRNTTTLAGEKTYQFSQLERHIITFLRAQYLVEVGVDKRMCDQEKLPTLAQSVDKKLA